MHAEQSGKDRAMITIRDRNQRGQTKIEWLESKHSFSFGYYHDPNHMGFGPLRVLNEDEVKPGAGFGRHPHRDSELVTYVLDGGLEHKDSMGIGSLIKAGDVQRMSAGTGITHSEYNASKTDPVRFLQIWFLPEKTGIKPSYEQKSVDHEATRNTFKLVISPDGRENSITINQNIDFYVGRLDGSQPAHFNAGDDRIQWVQIARGEVDVNDRTLRAGDGAAISEEDTLLFDNATEAEILLFDMADIKSA